MAVFTGTNGNDNVVGSSTDDILYGLAGNDTLQDGSGNDIVFGGTGNDSLISYLSSGADTLYGESGDDSYFIGLGDTVIETANNGIDFIDLFASATSTYVIPDNVENLAVRSSTTIIGNVLGNQITVVNGANRIVDGGAGNDDIRGNNGNDILVGGSGNDRLSGNSGIDFLVGGAGNDTLFGGFGVDRHVFDTNAAYVAATIGVDTIGDFVLNSERDIIVLDKTTFTALRSIAGNGFSVTSEFARVTTDAAAATSSALIVFNSTNGRLFYNQNGALSGLGSGSQFATVNLGSSLNAADFVLQA